MDRYFLLKGTFAVLLLVGAGNLGAHQAPKYKVGIQPDGSIVAPDNTILTPAGTQVEFIGRPTAIAIRPDQQTAACSNTGVSGGTGNVVILDLNTGQALQQFAPYSGAYNSIAGLSYSPDGSKLYFCDDNAQIDVMNVASDGTVSNADTIYLPLDGYRGTPAVLAFSSDSNTLYVAMNFDNTLGVINVQTQQLVSQIPVGNAPWGGVVQGNIAFVSNQGGRPANPTDFTDLSANTPIVANPESAAPITGTVSVVDLVKQKEIEEIEVGIEPTAMVMNGKYLFVANTNSDTISVIDTDTRKVVKTISIKPFRNAPFGSQPNSLVFTTPNQLVVSLGTNNAFAVYDWEGPTAPVTLLGLIPTAWHPGSIAFESNRNRIDVANIKGVGSLGPVATVGPDPATNKTGHYTKSYLGSASLIPIPDQQQLAAYTRQVVKNNGWRKHEHASMAGANRQMKAKAIPDQIGDPSLISHVFYIIKENRTYDSGRYYRGRR